MTKVHLELERYIAADSAPHVLGSISVEGGAPTKFVGWVALLAQLEKSVEGTTPSEPPPAHVNQL